LSAIVRQDKRPNKMNTYSQSLSKIFTERLFRIPNYKRIQDYKKGYVWLEENLKDFWTDLTRLEEGEDRYVGIISVEMIPVDKYSNWEDDLWLLESKGYKPLYIIDGQQILTTSIILIQAIIETIPKGAIINYTTVEEIRKKFIFDSKCAGNVRTYIFGYEKDDPRCDFLKFKVFNEKLNNFIAPPETRYTRNLEYAKRYFKEQLSNLEFEVVEQLYRKLTQKIKFNFYDVPPDIEKFYRF